MPNVLTRRAFLAASSLPLAAAEAPPNIVLFLADDLGYGDVASYGCPDIRTPHIDAIARAGARLTRFYSNGPECTPTRTALLTGRYQHRVGGLECAIGVGDVGRYDDAEWLQKRGELGLPVSETTLPQMLKLHGYDTACIGKWHLGYPEKFRPNRHGFDEYFGILGGNADYFEHTEADGLRVLYHNEKPVERKGYLTDLITQEAVAWLRGRSKKPFFLYVPFTAPHTPIQEPDGSPPKGRATFARMVERMDEGIGAVLAQLDRMGAAANTIVIFASDNGGDPNGRNAPLRGRKGTLWEGGIRVPCAIRWPGRIPEQRTVSQVALSMDLTPTLLAAVGAKPPSGRKLDGFDLLAVLQGKREPFPRTVFWRSKRAESRRKAVLDGDWKYVFDNGSEELLNLSVDQSEKQNLLDKQPRRAEQLKAKLAAWEKDVMAPRLRPFRTTPG